MKSVLGIVQPLRMDTGSKKRDYLSASTTVLVQAPCLVALPVIFSYRMRATMSGKDGRCGLPGGRCGLIEGRFTA